MSENNDFEWQEFMDSMLSAMDSEQDLEQEITCAKCKTKMLYKNSAPISYENKKGERQTYYLCFDCCKQYIEMHNTLERNFIRWFLGEEE